MITESLGIGVIGTDIPGYLQLIDFYVRCSKYRQAEIIIAFENITWIDGNMAALLMAIVQKLESEHNNLFFVDREIIKDRFGVLIRNGWLAGVEFIPKQDNKSEIKLTGFDTDEDVRFIQYIEIELLSNENLNLQSNVKKDLVSAFLELFCNVQKHARTDAPVFACGQYYTNSKRLSFTLVDTGVGYLPPIKEFTNSEIATAGDAILWALKGNTTKVGTPGGLGLREIQKFCSSSGSAFSIITGGAYWVNNELFPVAVKPFSGTIVNVIFECKR